MSIQGLCPFLDYIFFLLFSFWSSVYVLDINPLSICFSYVFLPFCGLPFYSVDTNFFFKSYTLLPNNYFLIYLFLFGGSLLTMLCWFLPNISVNQPGVIIRPLLREPPSHLPPKYCLLMHKIFNFHKV